MLGPQTAKKVAIKVATRINIDTGRDSEMEAAQARVDTVSIGYEQRTHSMMTMERNSETEIGRASSVTS